MKIIPRISKGPTMYLVHDESLVSSDAAFYKWLVMEGFSVIVGKQVRYDQPWVLVDLARKTYIPGPASLSKVDVFADHDISIADFRTVYSIVEKYHRSCVYVFDGNRYVME